MKFSLNKDFCLWVVPPHDGRVRKLRFTYRAALGVLLTSCILVGGVAYVAGDYTRLQILRAKSFFSVMRLNYEKENLAARNRELSDKVGSLETSASRVLNYERGVKQRLDELMEVIGSATTLGLIDPPVKRAEKDKTAAKGGVGGAEIDCKSNGGKRCVDMLMSDTSAMESLESDYSSAQMASEEDLIELLDRYILVLKALPLGSPGDGHINSGFGLRVSPFTRSIKMHEGVDLSLPFGSYIYATADGVVGEVKRTPTYGMMIDISHSKRVVTRYAHLSKTFVQPGDRVCRGEVIGLVGSTGRSTGAHLHYEVRVDRKPRNPKQFIELAKNLHNAL